MNNLDLAWARTSPNAKSVSEWIKYESFIDAQLTTIGDKNVEGLECSIIYNKVNYQKSNFNILLSKAIKNLYINQIKTEVDNIPLLRIFTSVFKDERAYFLPYNHKIDGKTINLIRIPYENDKMIKIFNGIHNNLLDEFLESERTNSKNYNEYLEKQSPSFLALLKMADEKPVLFLTFYQNFSIYHAIAMICFKKEGVYNFMIYDPMYYNRPEKEDSYNFALEGAYINYYLLAKKHGVPIKIENLSLLCPITAKGQHCVQYIMNAEYCSIYCLYFLYLYAKADYPMYLEDIQPVVNQTFMVAEPLTLTRKVCAETSKFKIKIISFALTMLLLFVEGNNKFKAQIISLANSLEQKSGIKYIRPDLITGEGGRRRLRKQHVTRKRQVGRKRGGTRRRRS